jgi:ATP/maltotriose-dependent transcriptional regulator MalT
MCPVHSVNHEAGRSVDARLCLDNTPNPGSAAKVPRPPILLVPAGANGEWPEWLNGPLSTNARASAVLALAAGLKVVSPSTLRRARSRANRAWASLLIRSPDQARAAIRALELCLGEFGDEVNKFRAEFNAIRAMALALCDDTAAALPIAEDAFAQCGSGAVGIAAATTCRLAHWRSGDLVRFHALRPAKIPANGGRRWASLEAFDRSIEAIVELQQLRLATAHRLARNALESAQRLTNPLSPATFLPAVVMAELLYERGDVDEAEELLRARLPRLLTTTTCEIAVRAFPLLAKISARRGQRELVLLLLREGEGLGEARRWSRLVAVCLAARVDFLVSQCRVDEAEFHVQRLEELASLQPGGEFIRSDLSRLAILARCQIPDLDRNPRAPIARIREFHHEAVNRGDYLLAVQMTIRLVDALGWIGDDEEAAEVLAKSVAMAANAGLYQSFLDGGPQVQRVLSMVLEGSPASSLHPSSRAYAESLIIQWAPAPEPGAKKTRRTPGPLSPRECLILRLVSRGLSNKMIAQQLDIAPETVKSHLKHLFIKLAARTRAEAVSRAESLGFI